MSLVSSADLESHLQALASSCSDPRAGLFGPHSAVWRVSRESAIFLGAGRAALLQLAHPWVAAAITDHSTVLHRPIARFHNTFRVVFTMVFGSLPQAVHAARQLHSLHTTIQGALPEPAGAWPRTAHYEANDLAALRWVFATLVDSAVLAYSTVLPLSPDDRDRYYQEMHRFAALFGIPAAELPADWPAFAEYTRAMADSTQLAVTPAARVMGQSILAGAGSALHPPRWFRALTAQWLPPRLRDEFALPLTPRDRRAIDRALRWFPRLYAALPAALRYVGPYHEACARLAGSVPGPLTRRNTRFWIGEPTLPASHQPQPTSHTPPAAGHWPPRI